MPILSALDSISPAFARTKLVLFSPFRKGRTWKLCATAYLSMGGVVFIPFAAVYLFFIPAIRSSSPSGPVLVTVLISVVAVFTLIQIGLLYVFTRLRFASFDITLNHGQFVGPAWSKYGSQTLKWALFKFLLGCVFTAIIAVPVAHIARQFTGTFASLNLQPGAPPSPEFMQTIFSIYAAFFLVYFIVGLFFFLSSLLTDFVVPSLALEDTSLSEAFRRLGLLIKQEPGQFTLYAVLKFAIGLVCYFGATIAFEIVIFLLLAIIGLVALLIGYILHLAGVPNGVLFGIGIFLAVVLYLVIIFYGAFIVAGTVLTYLESYTLYFLSGRYPMLGELLAASTPPPATTSPLHPVTYPPYVEPPLVQ